jgi:predicted unusual protein kinase regulating ubiquinone biosynthesis (AarF/ABC1/UbiB family)
LAPIYIKPGQLLSTRHNIFSSDIIKELQRLQDRLPPILSTQIKAQIHQELGEARTTNTFATNFTDNPGVRIPAIFWEQTGHTVLTMENISTASKSPTPRD